uniref:Ribonuclease E n=1 Tax=Anotrichium furcellatum TaxID=41999 RepID=A0A4D6WJ67_9FLOR|nr:ribonuclease E [Anotrichium furcellatum]
MIKKIVISHFNNVAAILQNNKVEEIVVINHGYQVNDIYIGIVHKIFSSINAAFIKLGRYGKSGFIHISDIKALKKDRYINHINEILSINQLVLVQIIKEPTLNKGPRLTANIHLQGRYVVLMPFCNTIIISHKIYDVNERTYLHSLALLMKPDIMGLLIKQTAQGVSEKFILEDIEILKKQWYFIEKTFISMNYPRLIYRDADLIKKIVRDFYEDSIQKIIIDSQYGLRLLYYYLNRWNCISPVTDTSLQLYNKSKCILQDFSIKQAIQEALKSKVKLLYGGYIIIQNYEALTVIDVNSGSFNKSQSSKATILRTNLYAATEIAHQLKMRNINGVIIIDFIDMHSYRDQLQLLEHFNKSLKLDNARPQIVQLSELGLVELTRRRRGQSLQEIFGHTSDSKKYFSRVFFESGLKDFNADRYTEKQILAYKSIKSLFFGKKFKKKIPLEVKRFNFIDNSSKNKYFINFDKMNSVSFFKPKANYIVPLIFYLDCLNYPEINKKYY